MTAGLIAALGLPLWQKDGVGLCVADGHQYTPQLVSDGAGGAIVAWEDKREGSQYDIYAQQVDAGGNALWAADGVPVCVADGSQSNVQLIADGFGGAFVTWHDARGAEYDIYAQRLDKDGNALWTTDGVSLCVAPDAQYGPQIIDDDAGGAIVAWTDYRQGPTADIYARRVDGNGNALWYMDGVTICAAAGDQYEHQIAPDGEGGAIIAWADERSGGDIYAQRVNAKGVISWTTDGIIVCAATGVQEAPDVLSDGSGGAFIVYMDSRSGSYDIYAQRLDSDGNLLWAVNGVGVCTASGNQGDPRMAAYSAGGLFVTWTDFRSGGRGIYAQRLKSNGASMWAADGVPVGVAGNNYSYPQIAPDGSGGALVTWMERRPLSLWDIYAQRMDAGGNALWQPNGVPVCTADDDQRLPQLIDDGAGGAFIAWYDERSGTYSDIYAQRVIDLVPTDLVNLPLVAKSY